MAALVYNRSATRWEGFGRPGLGEITKLLWQFESGDTDILEKLTEKVYPSLRQIAAVLMSRERGNHTLQPTALVNESMIGWLRGERAFWENRQHFYSAMARRMRHILVDYARRRHRAKRDFGVIEPLDHDVPSGSQEDLEELIALDDLLNKLESIDGRAANVVELSFFAGLTFAEIAEVLKVSVKTVERDWAFARAWLHDEFTQPPAS